jgi:AraC family ethanolamine operon transcriptional activator
MIYSTVGYKGTVRFGQTATSSMANDAVEFLDYEITDAESYATVLRGADVEISQLEPGPLRGHHLRVGLPSGDISWVVTNLPLRGHGRFPSGVWTLSVVMRSASLSLQHGVEVRPGCPFYHRPGAEQDGIYGRGFSVVCLGMREEFFAETVRNEFPELSDRLGQRWRVYEPAEGKRRELIAQFEQAATVLRSDERVRRSSTAKAVMQDELLAAFLEALAEGITPPPMLALSQAAALVRRAEELARESDGRSLWVGDLCVGCGVPRRTLNHAFQQVLGMGPATYLRRLRLNQVRRSLRQPGANGEPTSVAEIALDHGFWHPSRFSSQYRELFGESPRESARR